MKTPKAVNYLQNSLKILKSVNNKHLTNKSLEDIDEVISDYEQAIKILSEA
jgi:hypothetical protein